MVARKIFRRSSLTVPQVTLPGHRPDTLKTRARGRSRIDDRLYAITFRLALARAGITDYVRPFHDGRHTSLTNAAAAGMSGPALMARAGHSDFKTTQGYIDLAGETFREEEELLEARLFGTATREE
jgi:integrase